MNAVGREWLGEVIAGCELREVKSTGAGRHHYYRSVLRDLIGNVWECEDRHRDQDAAHDCARTELARRVAAGQLKGRQRRRAY